MLFSLTDRRFEEAGRNPELYEKLLRDLQRARKSGCISFLILGALLVGGLGWLAVTLSHAVELMSHGKPLPPIVDWMLANKGVFLVYAVPLYAVPLLVGLVQQYVLIKTFDTRIKMLLFLRAQQNRPS